MTGMWLSSSSSSSCVRLMVDDDDRFLQNRFFPPRSSSSTSRNARSSRPGSLRTSTRRNSVMTMSSVSEEAKEAMWEYERFVSSHAHCSYCPDVVC